MSDVNAVIVQPLKQFVKDSVHLVKKCTKPDRKEFTRIAWATGVGFLIMGASQRPVRPRGVGHVTRAKARRTRSGHSCGLLLRLCGRGSGCATGSLGRSGWRAAAGFDTSRRLVV